MTNVRVRLSTENVHNLCIILTTDKQKTFDTATTEKTNEGKCQEIIQKTRHHSVC